MFVISEGPATKKPKQGVSNGVYLIFSIHLFYRSDWQYRTASLRDHLCNQKIFDVLWMIIRILLNQNHRVTPFLKQGGTY